jgi:hypothetical protein
VAVNRLLLEDLQQGMRETSAEKNAERAHESRRAAGA